jgi:hypothetical protein
MFGIRKLANVFVILFACAFAVKFNLLSRGDILNFYPFVSPDGFDWYTEGVYLININHIDSSFKLPILRPPFFVFVTAIDFSVGNVIVLPLVYALSMLITYFGIMYILDGIDADFRSVDYFAIPVAILTTVFPINFFKSYLLSDSLAVSLVLLSIYFLQKFYKKTENLSVVLSIVFAASASLTQTYAIIPYFIFSSTLACFLYGRNKNKSKIILYSIFTVCFMYLLGTFFWRLLLEHDDTPKNFGLLKFDLSMMIFYLNTWLYYFFVFVMAVIYSILRGCTLSFNDPFKVAALATTIVMAVLCFLYQWPDARFTYYFWPWFIIAFFAFFANFYSLKACLILSILFLFNSFIALESSWQPNLKSVSIDFRRNWAYEFFLMSSVDRKLEECKDHQCLNNQFLSGSDPYVKSVVGFNLRIKKYLDK